MNDEIYSTPPDVDTWKNSLRQEFEQWLATIDSIPDSPTSHIEPSSEPDLYSFFEALTLLTAESRKANRRTAEAFSQWNDVLNRFDQQLTDLRKNNPQSEPEPDSQPNLPRPHCLALIEILDRIHRLDSAFRNTPQTRWWQGAQPWRQAWSTQAQALDILREHTQNLLRTEGIQTLPVLGRTFDPSQMTAVASEQDPQRPHLTVIEEIAPAYTQNGQILRLAQVKVSRQN